VDGYTGGRAYGWTGVRVDGQTGVRVDGQTGGRVDGWTGKSADRTYGFVCRYRRLSEERKRENSGLTQPIYLDASNKKQIHEMTKETLTFQPCAAWLNPTSEPCAVTSAE
jgi:hypothetical protein